MALEMAKERPKQALAFRPIFWMISRLHELFGRRHLQMVGFLRRTRCRSRLAVPEIQ